MIIKKAIAFFISLVLMVTLTPVKSSSVSIDNCSIILTFQVGNKQYYVNDVPKLMDSEPEIKDSRMFLVIRFVTQHIPGTTLDWDGTERKVTIKTPGGKVIRLWIGNPKAEVNGKMVMIDPENPDKIVPYIKDGRTKLPMRFVSEQLEAKIDWIASSRTVILTIQDIINCGCSWLEGCIVQWTEAPNNQYQLSFVLNCDKKSTLERYLVEKNLKSLTEGADLTEYLQKYPKPPYPTTKICLNQTRKIIKWDPVRSPDTNPPPPPLKSFCGCFSQFNSESADGTKIWFNNSCNEPENKWKVYMIPKELKDQNLDLLISEYLVKYPLNKFKSLCLELYIDDKGVVKKWRATPEKYPDCCKPPTNKGPGRVIASLGSKCVGVMTTFANISNPGAEKLTIEANIKGNCDTGCALVFGDTYRVTPKSDSFKFTPEFIDIKVSESCPDEIIHISFDATEIPPTCCKWQFRLLPEIQSENWTLSPGETYVIEAYEIINTCSLNGNDLPFTINWPNDGKIISIEPSSFILKPSQHQILKIKIIMPEDSKEGEIISFPYTITPSGCEKKDVQIEVLGKIFLCKGALVNVKITSINQREGWIFGYKFANTLDTQAQSFAAPVKIYYEIGDDYWKRIKVDHCYKICYEERNDSGGKPIKWGKDYRAIDCPE